MDQVGLSKCSQLQYNTGAIFFTRCAEVQKVFEKWFFLCNEHGSLLSRPHDQPFFTLAMELLDFNPYTLSPAYNYRALGELVSGYIRLWHSRDPVPRRYLDGMSVPYAMKEEMSESKPQNSAVRLWLMIKQVVDRGRSSAKFEK